MRVRRRAGRPHAFLDIGESSLRVFDGARGLRLPLERDPNGRLTAASREAAVRHLRGFFGPGSESRPVLCGVPARGVSLRAWTLPDAPPDERERIVALRLEREMPLAPSELAWGYSARGGNAGREGDGNGRDVVVAALRRELLEEYEAVLAGCGLRGRFVPGILAAAMVCPRKDGSWCVLDIGRHASELLYLEEAQPTLIRSLPWGGEDVTRALAGRLGIPPSEAEALKTRSRSTGAGAGGPDRAQDRGVFDDVTAVEAVRLHRLIADALPRSRRHNGGADGLRVFLVGEGARLSGLAEAVQRASGGSLACQALPIDGRYGRSAVALGLQARARAAAGDGYLELLVRDRERSDRARRRAPARLFWGVAALVLVVAFVALRYAVAARSAGAWRDVTAELRARRDALPAVDRELEFLEHLDRSRLPCLDSLLVCANLAPKGTFLTEFSVDRSGEVTLAGRVPKPEDLNEYGARLGASGWFDGVVIHDRTVSKDEKRKGIVFRLTARLAADARSRAVPAPAGAGTEGKASPPARAPAPGGGEVTSERVEKIELEVSG